MKFKQQIDSSDLFQDSVLADTASICASLKTKDACAANTSCKFTSSNSTCTNKCNALSTADCALPANSANCVGVGTCSVSTTVCSGYTSKTDCQGQSACQWTEAVAATCSNKASIQSDCNVKNQTDCSADNKCTYVPAAFQACSYKAGQCAGKTGADCVSTYCNYTPSKCSPLGTTPCNTINDMTVCANNTGCTWFNSNCSDSCQNIPIINCAYIPNICQVKATSCVDISPNDPCTSFNETQCQQNATFCQKIGTQQACNAKASYCSSKNPTDCASDANCIATPAVAGFCSNISTPTTCSGLQTQSTCNGNAGCTWNFTCKNKEATSCQTTDNQASCTGSGKFCDYAEIGTCSASNTSSSTPNGNSQTSSNNSSTSGYSSSTSKSFSSILVIILIAIIDLI
ncbi:hypothetical protein ABPG74_013436 [Tetrahymena malaccensis]